jgi:hypothetical protein
MQQGTLTAGGAERLGCPDLADSQVDYADLPGGMIALAVFYRGAYLGGPIDIGAGGILPLSSQTDDTSSHE